VPHATVLALDPAVLHDQSEDAVRQLLKEGESVNTRRSYAGALRYWAAWFRLRYRQPITLPVPTPLSGQAIWLIVKRRAQLACVAGDFGAHSLRSGFVTEAGRQNVPLGEAMGLTGHRWGTQPNSNLARLPSSRRRARELSRGDHTSRRAPLQSVDRLPRNL